MIKKTLSLMLAAAIIAVSGCNSGTAQTTTESIIEPSEAWDYEMYIEDLDYYMDRYIQNYDSARNAFGLQDAASTKNYLEEVLDALGSLENVIYPPNLEEVHREFLYAVGLQKELAESNIELTSYIDISGNPTAEEQSSLDNLNAEAEEILAKIEDGGDIREAWMNAKNAAFSYLPNGEYKAYVSTLTVLWDKYINKLYEFEDACYNGNFTQIDKLYEKCIDVLSDIENIDTPESLSSYQAAIIEAISTDRNYCLAMKTMADLAPEYGNVAEEDLPDDVKATVIECTETINNFYNYDYEAGETDPLSEAVYAALDFADSQA